MMRTYLHTTTLVLTLLASVTAFGQFDPSGGFDDGKLKVEVHSAKFEPASAAPGDSVYLEVEMSVATGWHIYGTRSKDEFMLGGFDDLPGLQADGRAVTPEGTLHDGNEWLEGKFKIRQKYRVPTNAEPGEVRLRGRFKYIPCTPDTCILPEKVGFTAVLAFGGDNPRRRPDDRERAHVRQVLVKPATIHAGDSVTLEAFIEMEPGWHVYGAKNEPLDADFADQRITLRIDDNAGLKPVGVNLIPDGKEHKYEGIDMTNWELFERFPITHELKVSDSVKPGVHMLTGTVTYSPCDETSCLTEQVITFGVSVEVVAGKRAKEASDENHARTDPAAGDAEAKVASASQSEAGANDGLWKFILLAVAGGLLALMMPCTYPMIPITISFFTKQASDRKGFILPLALTYGFGIVLVFVLIGLTVGELIIDWAQNEWLNIGIGLIFIVFAMSLFGAFALNPPRFLMNFAGKASGQGGFVGVFLMSTALVVTSFTCTGPFVGALLAVGASAEGSNLGRVALGMSVFGATMAIPFVLLSLLPGRLQQMPRSGEWMNTLKVFLGFIEFAAAIKFFQNAEIKMQLGFLTRELFLLMWAGTFAAAAAYLFGMIKLKSDGDGIGAWRMSSGLCTLLLAVYCFYGAMGHRMDSIMTAIIPPMEYGKVQVQAHGNSAPRTLEYTVIQNDYPAAIALAKKQGRHVVVNFTGYT